MREAGAEEVHFRVGSPAIVAPCYMGIDMATREELIAADRSTEEIREAIGADSLAYLSTEATAEALGKSRADLCMGCVTGEYPYDVEGETTDREVVRPELGREATGD
jgi:amidophosphoribosyltransferase